MRCAARTKGRVVEAKDEMDEGKKLEKVATRALCARKDSSPLLKAKEPRGRAESERRKRKCVADVDEAILDGRLGKEAR